MSRSDLRQLAALLAAILTAIAVGGCSILGGDKEPVTVYARCRRWRPTRRGPR